MDQDGEKMNNKTVAKIGLIAITMLFWYLLLFVVFLIAVGVI